MATPTTHCYQTHFYCAICGGPFAEVFRTAEERLQSLKQPTPNNVDSGRMSLDPDEQQLRDNKDPANGFNIPSERNNIISREELDAAIGTGAAYVKSLRLRAERDGQRTGYATEQRAVRHAYDGKLISVEDMAWTKNLRALIHRSAKKHPFGNIYEMIREEGGNPNGPDVPNTYLSGRGQIRKHYNWADAYADIDHDEIDDEGPEPENLFSNTQIRSNRFGFNVYQELLNKSTRDTLSSSSIPFHEDCWTLLNLAIEIAMQDRGVAPKEDEDLFSYDELWDTLAQLIGEASNEKNQFNFPAVLQEDPRQRGEVVTKLGLVDYRHSESSNEGWKWRHEEGLHWVVAEPTTQATLVRRARDSSPTNFDNGAKIAPRHYHPSDPFTRVPKEIIHMIFRYMSSTDVYSLRAASRRVHDAALPPETYRRFLETEFKYVPLLQLELEKIGTTQADANRIDYKGTFEWIRRSMRTPRPETSSLWKTEAGREWDEIDIGLKNRHRIWKIACPIAESFAETSSQVLLSRHADPEEYTKVYESFSTPLTFEVAKSIHVPRGYFGRISGGEGHVQSAYFGWDEMRIVKIRIFLTSEENGVVCGIRFYGQLSRDPHPLEEDGYPKLKYLFGRMGPTRREFPFGAGKFFDTSETFRGFDVRYRNGIIPAIRPIIHGYPTEWCGPKNGGVVRNMTVRLDNIKRFVGVAGFISSGGFIETFGLMEKGAVSASESDLIKRPSEPEFSAWKEQPPADLAFNRRVGVKLYNWRTAPCEWEIWDHRNMETEDQNSEIFLTEIVGYMCPRFLRGLRFVYINRVKGEEVMHTLGSVEGEGWSEVRFEINTQQGERILGAVISESTEGIHSLMLAVNDTRRSPSFGPTYLGDHRVFVNVSNSHLTKQLGHRFTNIYRLNPPIIGLHCIYDEEAQRFLQLGLIESKAQEFEVMALPRVTIPYSIYSELDGLSTWIDEPLPSEWSATQSSSMKYVGCRDLRTNMGDRTARFAAWIDFTGLKRVEFFGDMGGIRFIYWDSSVKEFGNTTRQDPEVKELGENDIIGAIGVRQKDQRGSLLRAATQQSKHFNPKADDFPRLGIKPADMGDCKSVFESRFLSGLKFLFSAQKITYWVPLFSKNPDNPDELDSLGLLQKYKCPWKQYHDLDKHQIESSIPSGTPSERSGYIITRYGTTARNKPIDRVRAYISLTGKFSGLVFSRSGEWDTEVFGVPTGIEITLRLQRGENFDYLWVSHAIPPPQLLRLDATVGVEGLPQPVVAIALATNKGRVTPWFGEPQGEVRIKKPPNEQIVDLIDPPQGSDGPAREVKKFKRLVGLTGNLKTHSDPMWRDMNILYRFEPRTTSPIDSPSPARLHFGPRKPPSTHTLEHLHDHSLLPAHFIVSDLQRVWVGEAVNSKGLTYTIFNPDQLQFINVYSKKPSINYGILGIGFEGRLERTPGDTGTMGAVLLGDVPDEIEIEDGRVGTLKLNAQDGERITGLHFAYGLGLESDNIMAIAIYTNKNQTLIHNAKGITFNLLDLAAEKYKLHRLNCPEGHEIIGIQALVRTRGKNIHDLALITRALPAPGRPPMMRPMDELIMRNSERGWRAANAPRSKRSAGLSKDGKSGDELNSRAKKIPKVA